MNVQELNRISADVISKLKDLAKGDPVKEKKIALAENVIAFATEVVSLSQIAIKKKRILKPIDRRPKHKLQRRVKIWQKLIKIRSLEIQRHMILQAPIPRFPKAGSAIVGKSGPELIINKDGKIINVINS